MAASKGTDVVTVFIDSHQQVAAGYLAHTPVASQWSLAAPHQRKRKAANITAVPEVPQLHLDGPQPQPQPGLEQQQQQQQQEQRVDVQGPGAQDRQEAPDWVTLAAFKHVLKPKITFTHSGPGVSEHACPEHQQQPTLTPQQQGQQQQQQQQHQTAVQGDQHHLQHEERQLPTQHDQQHVQQQGCQQQQDDQHARQQRQLEQQQEQGQGQQGIAQYHHCTNLYNTWVPNPAGCEVVARAHTHPVLLPPRSCFVMSDHHTLAPLVAGVRAAGGAGLLIADPPWENASARRAAAYASMSPGQLERLPLGDLLRRGKPGTLVALWVTNRPRIHRQLLTRLLPAWGLAHAATWYWLKVTHSGEPVTPLGVTHRQPWEQLWLCRPAGHVRQQQQEAASAEQGCTSREDGAQHGEGCTSGDRHSSRAVPLDTSGAQPLDVCTAGGTGEGRQSADTSAAICCSGGPHLPLTSQPGAPQDHVQSGVACSPHHTWQSQAAAVGAAGKEEAAGGDASAGADLRQLYGLMQLALSSLQQRGYFQRPSTSADVQGNTGASQHAVADLVSFQDQLRAAGAAQQLPQQVVLVSVPGAHSRKPQLDQLLSPWVEGADAAAGGQPGGLGLADGTADQVVKVELFARQLNPGWISWGNEVLRFQDAALFAPVQSLRPAV